MVEMTDTAISTTTTSLSLCICTHNTIPFRGIFLSLLSLLSVYRSHKNMQYSVARFSTIRIGIPTTKYHFRVLCRKRYIPMRTPTLPKIVARKKSIPSDIRSDPFLLDRCLSIHMSIKAILFMQRKKSPINSYN